MATKYFCLVFYAFILILCCEQCKINANEYFLYSTSNTQDKIDSNLEFVSKEDSTNNNGGLRIRRDLVTEAPLPEKTRPTKKPYTLNPKQTNILADGSGNKTSKFTAKDPPPAPSINTSNENSNANQTVITTPSIYPTSYSNLNLTQPTTTHPDVSTVSATTSTSTAKPWVKASGPPSAVLLNVTIPSETEIHITRFLDDEDISNRTLKEHNITSLQEDHHYYYNSTVLPNRGRDYWVDMDSSSNLVVSDILSKAHRRAVTVKLSFDFPFYGHRIRNMTIATGGFLYTGEYVHAWLAATQYIAPLMANFDTSLSNTSFVKHLDNGTAFTVQWENVVLQESPQEGSFTFQCTMLDTGDIIFVYRNVPLIIDQIEDHQHPVKVGLSDAYIIDRSIFYVRRKTIYEYHRVDFKRNDIKNWTAIVLTALDTCLDMKDCVSCVSRSLGLQEECNWCSGRCSNGMDRHRQDWLHRGCASVQLLSVDMCPAQPTSYPSASSAHFEPGYAEEEGVGIGAIFVIILSLTMVLFGGIWFVYAYRNPHTSAGQFLIRYRPTTWSWRRGEARYTVATIHM